MEVEEVNNIASRYYFPDVLKSLLIYLVILGHLIGLNYKENMDLYWSNPLITFIYSFHMPLFIAISGYFLGSSSNTSLLVIFEKKIKRLTFPILLGLILCFIFDSILGIYPCKYDNSILKFYNYLTKYWFLNCLLVLSVIVPIIMSLRKIFIMVFFTILFLSIVFYSYLPSIIIKDWQIIRLMPIFILSYVIGQHKNALTRYFFINNTYKILLFSGASSFLIWFICGYNLLKYICFARILIGIFSSIAMVSFIFLLYSKLPYKIIIFLSRIGKNSLGIYLFHIPIFKSIPKIDNFIYIFLLSLVLLFVTNILTDLFRTNKIGKILLGEK